MNSHTNIDRYHHAYRIMQFAFLVLFFLPPWGGQRGAFAQNYQWAHGLGAGLSDIGRSIAVDDSGNVYVAGDFTDLVDFDPGPGTATFYAGGGYGFFVIT